MTTHTHAHAHTHTHWGHPATQFTFINTCQAHELKCDKHLVNNRRRLASCSVTKPRSTGTPKNYSLTQCHTTRHAQGTDTDHSDTASLPRPTAQAASRNTTLNAALIDTFNSHRSFPRCADSKDNTKTAQHRRLTETGTKRNIIQNNSNENCFENIHPIEI